MSDTEYKKYLDAIDIVCGNCYGTEMTCKNCPVRICCDNYNNEKKRKCAE